MGNENVRARKGDLRVARVLSQDDDFATVEIAKRDDVPFLVNEGDEFLTILFVHQVDGGVSVWDPFA